VNLTSQVLIGSLLMSGRRSKSDTGEPDLWSNGSVFEVLREPISIDPSLHISLQQTTLIAGCNDLGPGNLALWNGDLTTAPIFPRTSPKKHLCATMRNGPMLLQSAVGPFLNKASSAHLPCVVLSAMVRMTRVQLKDTSVKFSCRGGALARRVYCS